MKIVAEMAIFRLLSHLNRMISREFSEKEQATNS